MALITSSAAKQILGRAAALLVFSSVPQSAGAHTVALCFLLSFSALNCCIEMRRVGVMGRPGDGQVMLIYPPTNGPEFLFSSFGLHYSWFKSSPFAIRRRFATTASIASSAASPSRPRPPHNCRC